MRSLKRNYNSIRTWISQHRIFLMITAGAFIIGTASIATLYVLTKPQPVAIDQTPPPKPKPAKTYNLPLTGMKTTDEADLTKPVTAIMLENSLDARPQSGLKEAEVIYEAVAEAGITRFLAVYQKNAPELVGPVRSVRPYYVEWAKPYDASIAHIGGSQRALQEIRNGEYRDIDQFFNADTYWRATDRLAPHNVYTSFEKLQMLNAKKGYTSSQPKVFERGETKPLSESKASSISVGISSPTFNSSYTYDAKTNSYARSQAGQVHLDREKGAITPAVVIVMKVNETTVQEETARQSITTTGSGPVTIFQNGDVIEGTWQRLATSDQFKFTDTGGTVIKLAPGQTWITAINQARGTVSWQ